MRSQNIKIRNIPILPPVMKTVHVKPAVALMFVFIIGCWSIFRNANSVILGVAIMIVAMFAILFLPDRILVQFTSDYLILYNCHSRDECMLVYWDEIVSWQYEWHASVDELVITLTDGSTQTAEMYSKASIYRAMSQFAPGKERKSGRIGRAEQ